jgi:prophage regulatory protein
MDEDRYLRRTEVEALTALSRASIYRMMADGRFVRPYRIGKSAVRWRYSEVQAWLAARPRSVGGWLLSRLLTATGKFR